MTNYAFVLLTKNIFGGAEKRFSQLVKHFYYNSKNASVYFIVTHNLRDKLLEIYNDFPQERLISVGDTNNKNAKAKFNKDKNTYTLSNNTKVPLLRKLTRFIRSYKYNLKLYRKIENIRKSKNIKCFIGVYSGIIPFYFYLKKKNRDFGIIFCDMDSWFREIYPKERKYWYKKYSSFNYALENSDYVDFLSPFILDGVKERGINVHDNKVYITPSSFADYSKCRIGDKTKFSVAFSGRLEKDKNPELFLDAIERLKEKHKDITFHIMGDGRLKEVVKKRVEDMKEENVVYHGFHNAPTEILANTTVFVSLQTTNNYPSQSVLEAMACQNAIIATNVGDTRMFINEKNGILIGLDAVELSNAIEKLYLNRELTKKMGMYAEKYVKDNHTIEKSAEYYLELFRKAEKAITSKNI